MNVLSLFDGMSCGQMKLLNRSGIKYDNYFELRNKKICTGQEQKTQHNYPQTIQLGDIRKHKIKKFK